MVEAYPEGISPISNTTVRVSADDIYIAGNVYDEIWVEINGSIIHHVEDGDGLVTHVEMRNNYYPLIEIKWLRSGSVDRFNNESFKANKWIDWAELEGALARRIVNIAKVTRTSTGLVNRLDSIESNLRLYGSSIVRVGRCLTEQDITLIHRWSNKPVQKNNSSITATNDSLNSLMKDIGVNDAVRLWSARGAELAAAEYYRDLGFNVTDVSIEQLNDGSSDWKTHDLKVEDFHVDVKNARRSYSSPDSYSEYCVPKFKNERRSGVSVKLVGVLSDYQTQKQMMDHEICFRTVLGEVDKKDIDSIQTWLNDKYGHIIDVKLHDEQFIPGWLFEYSKNHYPERDSAQISLSALMRDWMDVGLDGRLVPRYLLALVDDEAVVRCCNIDEAEYKIWRIFRELDNGIGLSRRTLFGFVLGWFLSSVRNKALEPTPVVMRTWLFPLINNEAAVDRPLGLQDDQRFIANLISVFETMWNHAYERLLQFTSFRLRGPNILQGRTLSSGWVTILAYCGGWIAAKAKCGNNPIYLGMAESCVECGHLICPRCGFCSRQCVS